MNWNVSLPLLVLSLIVGNDAYGVGAATSSFNTTVKPLIDGHCTDCHGADEQKAGLRLDTLATDFTDDKTMDTWVRVLDKLASGEMPPKKKQRPPQHDIDAATTWLNTTLHAASLARQQKKGRVLIRRLNATEYENTIDDLLNTKVNVKDLLPEDNTAAGFDNVSAALDLSATHLLRFQDAAERAISSAIPVRRPAHFTDQRSGLVMTQKGPNFKQTLTKVCKLQGDSLIVYGHLPRYGLCSTAQVPTAGRYHVQISAAAVGEDTKSITAGLLTVGSGPEQPVVFDFRDIPAGKPTLIEFDVDLERSQSVVINLQNNWNISNFKKPLDEYTGPGLLLEWMKIDGPNDAITSPAYEAVFGGVPVVVIRATTLVPTPNNPRQDAERLIRGFLPRAFRRPVSEELQRHFVQRVIGKLDEHYTFVDAMMYGYKSVLSSPEFLFFDEPGSAKVNAQGDLVSPKLDDYALAERLSYFLWSTLPDDELLKAAKKGDLSKPAMLDAQVERMLNSPKAHHFTEDFTGQWLDLRRMDATIPDPRLYGDFDGLLDWSMPRETWAFFEEVLHSNLSVMEFVDSDWTMLNGRMAEHYGIAGVEGNAFRKVKLPPGSHRGGVMTQASVLKVTADGTRTSPVLRGKWILERIVGKPPNPPPPDVPALEPDIRGATTIRQQLDKHRNIPACAACHNFIDPPGFALESYDPIGGWRDYYRVNVRTRGGIVNLPRFAGQPFYRGPDVELGGQTPDGHAFHDIDDFKKILLLDKDQIARNLTQKLIVYATGADIQFADREVVEQIVASIKAKNYGFRTLVHDVVQSRVFLNK